MKQFNKINFKNLTFKEIFLTDNVDTTLKNFNSKDLKAVVRVK